MNDAPKFKESLKKKKTHEARVALMESEAKTMQKKRKTVKIENVSF